MNIRPNTEDGEDLNLLYPAVPGTLPIVDISTHPAKTILRFIPAGILTSIAIA